MYDFLCYSLLQLFLVWNEKAKWRNVRFRRRLSSGGPSGGTPLAGPPRPGGLGLLASLACL